MTVVSSSVLRSNFSEAVKQVIDKKDYLLVSNRGKITSALVDIDLLEDLLMNSDKDFLEQVKKARRQYENGEVSSHEDVFGEL